MQVWNAFDPKIIYHIIGKERAFESRGGCELSVDEMVRKTAIQQVRLKKLASSSQGFFSHPSTSVPMTERYRINSPEEKLTKVITPSKTSVNFFGNGTHMTISAS